MLREGALGSVSSVVYVFNPMTNILYLIIYLEARIKESEASTGACIWNFSTPAVLPNYWSSAYTEQEQVVRVSLAVLLDLAD